MTDDDADLTEAETRYLEARAKLHPTAQVLDTLLSRIGNILSKIGYFIIVLIIILAILAPNVLSGFVHFLFGGG